MKKTIILGVRNSSLKDDSVGVHVAEELKKHVRKPGITIDSAFTNDMNLLDLMANHDRAILIDAIKMKNRQIGDVGLFGLGELSAFNTSNPPGVSLPGAIDFARKLGHNKIPKDIRVVGINIGELGCEFGEEISSEIQKAIPKAVELVKKEVESDR